MMKQFSVSTNFLTEMIEFFNKLFSFIGDIFKIIGWLLIVGLIYYFHFKFGYKDNNNFNYLTLILYSMCFVGFGCIILKPCFFLSNKIFGLIRYRIYRPGIQNLLAIITTTVMIASIFYIVNLLFLDHSMDIIKAVADNHFLTRHPNQG